MPSSKTQVLQLLIEHPSTTPQQYIKYIRQQQQELRKRGKLRQMRFTRTINDRIIQQCDYAELLKLLAN